MQNSQENFKVKDNSSLHKYRTEHPNILYEKGLDPFEFTLYSFYKKIAGDGGCCTVSNTNLAKMCGMSVTTLKDRRNSLKEKGLIYVTERKKEDGNDDTTLVEIVDLWVENFQVLTNRFSDDRGGGRQKTGGVSPDDHKEEPLKKEPKKNNNKDVIIFSCLKDLDLEDSLCYRLMKNHSEEKLALAVKRTLAWKNRDSDALGINTVLSKWDEWVDTEDQETRIDANTAFLSTLKHFDMKKVNNMSVSVGCNYIEFSGGTTVHYFSVTDRNFQENVKTMFERGGIELK